MTAFCAWFGETFHRFFFECGKESSAFRTGYLSGLIAAIVFFLLVFLLLVLLKRCRGTVRSIPVNSEDGAVSVSSGVIQGMIGQRAEKIRGVQYVSSSLKKFHENFRLEITVDYVSGNGISPLPETVEAFRKEVRDSIENVLGITNIARIDFTIRRASAEPSE